MPPPPTRKEQLELDELLSDIYRGIEALPDKSAYNYTTTTNNNNSTIQHSGTYGSYQFNNSAVDGSNKSFGQQPNTYLTTRTHVKEYELPASSPLVKQHLAALREESPAAAASTTSQQQYRQPQRSTLKRNTNTPDIYNQTSNSSQARAAPQSLASFVTSTPTPENKRRVRIVDHPESRRNNNPEDDDDDDDYADYSAHEKQQQHYQGPPGERVKYVNTNKLIYHQEKNPDDEPRNRRHQNLDHDDDEDADFGDDIDGKTRVEYYHTTWLDRQLGRASKRRSSKELNERQVKEKAMIEELKRSLKSGAITLRQSLRGNKQKNNKQQQHQNNFTDDYQIDSSPKHHSHHHHHHSSKSSSNAIGSGLATIPRNYYSGAKVSYPATPVCYDTWVSKTRSSTSPKQQHQPELRHHHSLSHSAAPIARGQQQQSIEQQPINIIEEPRNSYAATTPKHTSSGSNLLYSSNNTNTNNNYYSSSNNNNNNNYSSSTLNKNHRILQNQQQQPNNQMTQTTSSSSNLYSRTLPHKSRRGEHSLIESHLRGGAGVAANRNYTLEREPVAASPTLPYSATAPRTQTPSSSLATDSMRNNYASSPAGAGLRSPSCDHPAQPYRQRAPPSDTIGNIPSATEVVRSALSRSSSQVSLNQLNKTINLLPNSPPPYSPSPSSTPTQQHHQLNHSVSPSPATGNNCSNLNSNTQTNTNRQQQQQQQPRLYGTRTLDRNPGQQQPPNKQPIYANPHASLMQHKAEQQARQPHRNTASIREFNELDNLLRSLSPASSLHPHQQQHQQHQHQQPQPHHQQSSAQITPGFSTKPAQTSIGGYGFSAPAARSNQPAPGSELYAQVHKQPGSSIYQTPVAASGAAADQTKASYLHQNYALAGQQQHQQPYTIDVTNKKADENCYKRQDLSEFEAPIELLPSMEDYQNITKLNPVKNHYWYKPNMGRDRAISLLKDKPQGTFIVRDSTSFRGAYGLALKVAKLPKSVLNNSNLRNLNPNDPSAELIRHFLIEPTPGQGVRLKGYENEPVFNSLPDLIYQHSLTELALPCRLIIPRADIEDPNFNLKQKQFFDDFVASKEQAKHLPYERTSPNGGYRKYPGDVYVHNEHRIIFE